MSAQKEAEQVVTIAPAQSFQLEKLRRIAVEAFNEGFRRCGMMPEGIETMEWHEEGLADGSYLAIETDRQIAGGARVFEFGDGTFRLGSLFIDPALHGQGIGKRTVRCGGIEPGESRFTEEEQAGGFAAMWVKPEEALRLMENDQPSSYSGHFIRCRDLAILRAFLA